MQISVLGTVGAFGWSRDIKHKPVRDRNCGRGIKSLVPLLEMIGKFSQ